MTTKSELPAFAGRTWESHVLAWCEVSAEIEERQWKLGAIVDSVARNYGERSIPKFASEVGCSQSTVWQYAQVYRAYQNSKRSENLTWSHHLVASYADDPAEGLAQAEAEGLSVQALRLRLRIDKHRHRIGDKEQTALLEALGKFRSILFRAIVVDPPWPYDDQGSRIGARKHYDTMTLDALATLPVGDLAAPDGCHLYLWVTNSFMRQGYELLDAWGFREKTIITWVKQTKSGKVNFGFGHYFRNATEHVIFAVRENMPTLRADQANILFGIRSGHSKKPERIYRLVEMMSPPPYLELFSRHQRTGWSVWGNEVEVISESYQS